MHIFNDELEARRGILNQPDIIIGIILVVVSFEAARQSYGKVLPIIGLIFIAYTFLAHYLPGPLWHFPISLDAIIAKYNMGNSGMFGLVLGISANYIFLFVLFGGLLMASGATRFFIEVAKLVSIKLASGAGMIAVVSSAMVGSVTGISGVNVVITGQFTIPTMKQVGYKPEQAGAIEGVASTGSSLVPPIMGMVAFIMAQYIGVPYIKVMAMAIIPAILYYLCLATFVHLNALKLKVSRISGEVDRRAILVSAPQFLVPLITIIVLLMNGYTPMYAAFWSVISVILVSLIRKETRGTFKTWLNGFVDGAKLGAQIAVISGIIGVVIASINVTAIGIKFPSMVEALSGGNLVIALLLVAFAAILLGCAMPPFAAYIIVAIMTAPVLVNLGVSVIQAHWFILFFCVFALITPPVGLAIVISSALAGSNYLKTSIEGVKASVIAFFLPFMVIWSPIIILQSGNDPLITAITKLAASLLVILFLQVGFVGYLFRDLNPGERSISLISAAAFIAFVITGNYTMLGAGIAIGIFLILWQRRKRVRAA